jgi:aryl-alcohol dehydrogenase-like predicted oxidoreductase
MDTRPLGSSSLSLTTIGLGSWAIGGDNWKWTWGPQDDASSIQAIQRALDAGVNWIDTAPVYGFGHAEEIIGKAIKGRRDQVILATKCSWRWNEEKRELKNSLKAASIREEVEESLQRLDTEIIDLYQLHGAVPEEELEEGWTCVVDLIREGKVRFGGISNFNLQQIKQVQAIHPVTSLQPAYSMINRGIEREIVPYCLEQNIGIIAYWPLHAGLLTGKFNQNGLSELTRDDWRLGNSEFQTPRFQKNLDLVGKLQRFTDERDKKLSHLAIAWVLHQPGVTSAIVGARTPAQLVENLGGAEWKLTVDELSEIQKLLDERDQELRSDL